MKLLLATFCSATALLFAGLLVRQVFAADGGAVAQALLFAVLSGSAAALLGRRQWRLLELRGLELLVFGALAAYLGSRAYASAVAELSRADTAGLADWGGILLQFALLMAAYGIFVPNHPARAALVVGAIAVTPVLVAQLLRVRHPELRAALDAAIAGRALDSVIPLGASALVAVFAALVIDKYFSVAYDSRRATFYDLEQCIGSGGMGEVWKARHRALARPAAVKLIREDRIEGVDRDTAQRVLRRFEREAQATASLRSPHTIEVFDAGVTADGHFYYAMELLEGLDLESLVARFGPIPAERAVHLLLQVCDSLADAHDHGLTHRDIKPANIHVSHLGPSSDHVKLLDFGLVKTEGSKIESGELTAEGTATGTPAYMAPEMATQGEVDGRADIYALGCVAYWLLTGRQVFEAEGGVAVIVEHVKTPPVPPSQRTEMDIPAELETIVLKCLEKEPGKRFQSAAELARALAAVPLSQPWSAGRAAQWWDLHMAQSTAA